MSHKIHILVIFCRPSHCCIYAFIITQIINKKTIDFLQNHLSSKCSFLVIPVLRHCNLELTKNDLPINNIVISLLVSGIYDEIPRINRGMMFGSLTYVSYTSVALYQIHQRSDIFNWSVRKHTMTKIKYERQISKAIHYTLCLFKCFFLVIS